jgi:hypothetical protein
MRRIFSDRGGARQQGRVGFSAVQLQRGPWSFLRFASPLALASALLVAGMGGCRGGEQAAPSAAPSAVASAAAAPRRVRLEKRPWKVGDRCRTVRTVALKLSVEFWQEDEKVGTNDSSRTEEFTRAVEVLGLVGGNPARATARYEHYALHEVQPNKPPEHGSELDGRTYEVDATEGKVHAKRADGKPLTPAEEATLLKLHADLGQDEPIVAALGTASMPIGQSAQLREEMFRAFMSGAEGEFKTGTLKLAETRTRAGREEAVLQWSGEMHTEEGNGLEITWHLSGEAVVGLSPARLVAASVIGSLDVTGHTMQNGARVTMAGAGTMKDERTLQYE